MRFSNIVGYLNLSRGQLSSSPLAASAVIIETILPAIETSQQLSSSQPASTESTAVIENETQQMNAPDIDRYQKNVEMFLQSLRQKENPRNDPEEHSLEMLSLKVVVTGGDVIWSGNFQSGDRVRSLRGKVAKIMKRPSKTIKLLRGLQELRACQSFGEAGLKFKAVITAVLLPAREGDWEKDFVEIHQKHGAPITASKDMFTCDVCEQDVPGFYRDDRDTILYCKECDFAIC